MIQTRGLAYRYPQGTLLSFPDVEVPQGAVLLLSGPSGCGKSTWLALVAALVLPTAGQVTVAGQALNALKNRASDAWRARAIGFLPQKLHLSSALTVQQNLAMAQWASGVAEDPPVIQATLQALGVADLAQRYPAQLSGGQAQRVALARAVLQKPQVILADEPTASLDDEAAADAIGVLLATARMHGATLVIATHDARVAACLELGLNPPSPLHRLQLQRAPAAHDGVAC
jgi:putative ABC transport system ATP-binding protein